MVISEELFVNFSQMGEGEPVVLVHGLSASRHDWDGLQPVLAMAGWSTYAVDLLGHGESAKPEEPERYHARTVYAAFENWLVSQSLAPSANGTKGENLPVLVGHSLGGYLSLQYAMRHPEGLRGLVLIDPLYSARQIPPVLRLFLHRPRLSGQALRYIPERLLALYLSLEPYRGVRYSSVTRHQIAADIKHASPHVYQITHTFHDLTPGLEKIQTPTLVIWGEKDLTLLPESFPRLIRHLPHAQGLSLPRCGHQPHISYPEPVARGILNYLQKIRLTPLEEGDLRSRPAQSG